MRKLFLILLAGFCVQPSTVIAGPEHLDLGIVPGIEKASLDLLSPESQAQGVLLLVPGQNGDGSQYLKDPKWTAFCEKNHLVLMGVTFVSKDDVMEEEKGYSRPALGSGKLIQEGLQKAGLGNLPLFLHGFSAGAQFVSRYVELYPEKIMGWSAYSAGSSGPSLSGTNTAPGIVSCGDLDGKRYGMSLTYFKQGRALDRKWTWVSVRDKGHEISPELEDFVRKYFSEILRQPNIKGVWSDAQTYQIQASPQPGDGELSWLPSPDFSELLRSFASY